MTRRLAAFDFDGTITSRDSLVPFCRLVAGTGRLFGAAPAFVGAVLGIGGRRDPIGDGRPVRGHPRDRTKQVLLARTFAGRSCAEIEALGHRYATSLPRRYRPDVLAALDMHRDRGDELVLVSATLGAYGRPAAAALGFRTVIAVELEVVDGVCTGRMVGPNVRGPEKAARLRELIGDADVEIWAYGNSAGDRELLAMADHPHRV